MHFIRLAKWYFLNLSWKGILPFFTAVACDIGFVIFFFELLNPTSESVPVVLSIWLISFWTGRIISHYYFVKATYRLNTIVGSHLLSMSFASSGKNMKPANEVSKEILSDSEILVNGAFVPISQITGSLVSTFCIMLIISNNFSFAYILISMVAVSLLVVILIIGISPLLSSLSTRRDKANLARFKQVFAYVSGRTETILFDNQKEEISVFSKNSYAYDDVKNVTAIFNQSPRWALELIIVLAIVMSGEIFSQGSQTLGFALVAVLRIVPHLQAISANSITLLSYSQQIKNIGPKLFLKPDYVTVSEQFRSPGNDSILKMLDQIMDALSSNQVVGLVGPSGCGKSTIAKVIAGLQKLNDLGVSSGREYVVQSGYVSQDFFLKGETIKDALDTFDRYKLSSADIAELLSISGFSEEERRDVLSRTEIGVNGHRLSGGQRQRLAIARAYLWSTELLILDESLSGVPQERSSFLIKELRKTRKILIISHRPYDIEQCDQIIKLKE